MYKTMDIGISRLVFIACILLITEYSTAFDSTEDIKKFMLKLEDSNEFVDYSLNLSELEKYNLDILKINETKRFSHDYHHQHDRGNLQSKITVFLQSLGNNFQISLSIAKLIDKIVLDIVNSSNKEIALVRINAYNPEDLEDNYDIPRWHYDVESFKGFSYKIIMTLKGSKTLFVKLPRGVKEELNRMQGYKDARIKIAHLIEQCIAVRVCFKFSADNHRGTVYRIGEHPFAALHSEPPTHSQRLFLSVK